MNIIMKELRKVMKQEFDGNITQTAKALNLNTSTLSRIMAGKSKAGSKVYEAIIKYCKEKDIPFEKIIEF